MIIRRKRRVINRKLINFLVRHRELASKKIQLNFAMLQFVVVVFFFFCFILSLGGALLALLYPPVRDSFPRAEVKESLCGGKTSPFALLEFHDGCFAKTRPGHFVDAVFGS